MEGFAKVSFDTNIPTFGFEHKDTRYVEIWNHEDDSTEIKEGPLPQAQVEDFIYQRGDYAPANRNGKAARGGVRILGQDLTPPDAQPVRLGRFVPLTRETFNTLIEVFKFPKLILHAYHTHRPIFYKLLKPKTPENSTILQCVINMNMMGPSFCLVYSYNASTNIASAYFSIEKHPNPAAPSRFEEVMKIIKACAAQATHPAFLLLMVTAHVSEIVGQAVNTTLFDISIIERFTNIVESLAIVESSSMQTVDDAHRKLATLSASLPSLWNSLDTHLIGCVEDIVKGLSEKLLLDEEFYMKHNTELLGLIGYLREHAKSHARMAEEVEKRAGTQFRILYNMINQHDSRLNLSMAADSRQVAIASKRDSSAMKTIAVLTIAFLPCTAVAAIFSMDPFMSLSPDGKIEISPMFWLYWTISIPLTIGVIAIWILWLWNKKYFEMKEDRKGEQQVLGASWKVNADSRPIVRGLTEEEKSITPLARRRGRSAGWGRLVRFKSSS